MKRMLVGLLVLCLMIPMMAQTEDAFDFLKVGQENALGAGAAVSPLVGIWKCSYKIGSKIYVDYITITSVSASGTVVGKNQADSALSGYTKNNMVFFVDKKESSYIDSYFWGYNGVLFAKHLGVIVSGYPQLVSAWHAMNQPTKVTAIPMDLPDRDFVEWSKSQATLDEIWQETQNRDHSREEQENAVNAESAVSPLIGIWKCRYKVGSSIHIDYITITSVSSSGFVTGKNQNNIAVSGYTKNNMVFLINKKANVIVDAYCWGYNGVAFAKELAVVPLNLGYSSSLYSYWYAMTQPTKVAAIPLNLPDRDSVNWSKSQSASDEMQQETQNFYFPRDERENAVGTEVLNVSSSALKPSSRSDAAMAYDPIRKKIVLFGGSGYIGTKFQDLGDTWVWDGKTWAKASTTGPSPRSSTAMDFDVPRKKMILFGGVGLYQKIADTWSWDGLKWIKVASTGPEERFDHSMAYFGKHKKILLFGGWFASDTWEWSGTKWEKFGFDINTDRAAMAYDKKRGRMVVFGGFAAGVNGDTWEYDGNNWVKISVVGPAARSYAHLAYDENLKKLILFGGFAWVGMTPTTYGDTWSWDGKTWLKLNVKGPSARNSYAMASDSTRKRIVLFGGNSSSGKLLNDTWEWTGKAWIKVEPK